MKNNTILIRSEICEGWEERFDKKFMAGNMNKTKWLLRDGNAFLMKNIKAFISQVREEAKREGEDKRQRCIECGEYVDESELVSNCHSTCRLEI
jgi:hypothetical protein